MIILLIVIFVFICKRYNSTEEEEKPVVGISANSSFTTLTNVTVAWSDEDDDIFMTSEAKDEEGNRKIHRTSSRTSQRTNKSAKGSIKSHREPRPKSIVKRPKVQALTFKKNVHPDMPDNLTSGTPGNWEQRSSQQRGQGMENYHTQFGQPKSSQFTETERATPRQNKVYSETEYILNERNGTNFNPYVSTDKSSFGFLLFHALARIRNRPPPNTVDVALENVPETSNPEDTHVTASGTIQEENPSNSDDRNTENIERNLSKASIATNKKNEKNTPKNAAAAKTNNRFFKAR